MKRILLAVIMAFGALLPVASPAAAAAPGADCGTPNDTPPAIFITNNTSCNGTHDGETYMAWWVSDAYGFAATVDDVISIGFTPQCHATTASAEGSSGSHYGHFTYKAPKSGPPGDEEAPQFYSLGVTTTAGFDGGGCTGTTNYNIGVYVTPNTRPTASFVSPPATALPGDPTTVVLAGTDADGNLRNGVLRITTPGFATQTLTAAFDASSRATFTPSFRADSTMTAWADDAFTAVSAQVTSPITLVQDDCGSGADVTSLPMTFPGTCHGHLAASMTDDVDTYTFDVTDPADRVVIEALTTSGNLSTGLTVTPPSGVAVSGVGPFFLPSEVGTWQVAVARTGTTYGGYDLSVRPIGAAAPPVVTASASPPNPHQWEPTTLSFSATDPNAERVTYQVNWGDGSPVQNHPASGNLASGTGGSFAHTYAASATPRTATISATNQEGLVGSTTVTVPIRKPNDVCNIASGAAIDSPATTANWTTQHNTRFRGPAPINCDGELGYVLNKTSSTTTIDRGDSYRFYVCANDVTCALSDPPVSTNADGTKLVRMTLTTTGTLSARLRFGINGSKVLAADATPGTPAVITTYVTPELYHDVYAELTSGTGAYNLDVALVPLA